METVAKKRHGVHTTFLHLFTEDIVNSLGIVDPQVDIATQLNVSLKVEATMDDSLQ